MVIFYRKYNYFTHRRDWDIMGLVKLSTPSPYLNVHMSSGIVWPANTNPLRLCACACVRACLECRHPHHHHYLCRCWPGGSSSGKYRKAAELARVTIEEMAADLVTPAWPVSCSTVINAFWIGLTRIKEKRRVSCPRIYICALMEKCITPDNSESVHTFDFHTYTWQRLIGKRPVRVCALILIYGWHGLETQAAALVAIIPYCRRAFSPP